MLIKNVECHSGLLFYKKFYVVEWLANYQHRVHAMGYDQYENAVSYASNRRNFIPSSKDVQIRGGVDIVRGALESGSQIDFSSCNHVRFHTLEEKKIDCVSAIAFLKEWFVVERLQNFHLKIHKEGFIDYREAEEYGRGGVIEKYSWEYKIKGGREIFSDTLWIGGIMDFSECVHIKIL